MIEGWRSPAAVYAARCGGGGVGEGGAGEGGGRAGVF